MYLIVTSKFDPDFVLDASENAIPVALIEGALTDNSCGVFHRTPS